MKCFCPTAIRLFAKLYRTTFCALLLNMNLESERIMENIESKNDKLIETLTKELESLSPEGLHEFFKFFYKISQGYMISMEHFEEFLEAFDSNPFKVNDDKKFRKQLIDNIIKYASDYMSLITAAVLIKKKFTIDEIVENYYTNVDVFCGNWY